MHFYNKKRRITTLDDYHFRWRDTRRPGYERIAVLRMTQRPAQRYGLKACAAPFVRYSQGVPCSSMSFLLGTSPYNAEEFETR
jgi:hypothetical protein